ncbi:MAG TPA: TatD family hydrolase [Candidatus Paceibacterota bacterium]
MPDYIDIHTHLNFAAFDADREEVIARTLLGKTWAINVGTQTATSQKAIELAEGHEGLFAAIGLHPIHTAKSFHDKNELGEGGQEFTSRGEVFDTTIYRSMAMHPKTVAIGECGLDYFRLEADTKERQRDAFIQQIELANEVKKPLMLHIRNAYLDAFEIIKAHAKVLGNLHFFAGTVEEAKPFLDLGYTFSFTGVITFAESYDEIIRYLPLESIMTETDAPYVAPAPHRGKRNEPLFVRHVVERIASIKGLEADVVKRQIMKNAGKFFSLSVIPDS